MQEWVQHNAGFEDVLPVLVFLAVVVAQLIKAGKKISGGERPAAPSGGSEPRDEIREFVERLTGEKEEPAAESRAPREEAFTRRADTPPHPHRPPPPPPPAPPRVRTAPVVSPVTRPVVAAVARSSARPKPSSRLPRPVVAKAPISRRGVRRGFSWDAKARAEEGITPERDAVLQALGDRSSLAQAIVLREILDAPVSLRARS